MFKNLILCLFILVPLSSFAKTLTCNINKNNAVLFESDLKATCKKDKISLNLRGIGIGLYTQLSDNNETTAGIMLQCYSEHDLEGVFYGINANMGVIGNLGVGFFGNQDGACVLTGLGLSGYGASLNGVELEIKKI